MLEEQYDHSKADRLRSFQCYEAKEDEDDLDNFDVDAWIKAVTEKEGEKVGP